MPASADFSSAMPVSQSPAEVDVADAATLWPATALEQSVPQRFEQQVARHAARVAIKTGSRTVTYAELNAAANRVAWAVLAQCGSEPARVALVLERNEAMIAALLGVLKAGKCYVPLDPTFPPARLQFMLDDVQTCLLLTNTTHLSLAQTVAPAGCQVLNLDQLDTGLPTDNPNLSIPAEAFCSILYTSGSTGQPKGVIQTHRNRLYMIRVYTMAMHLCATDRLALLTFGTGQAIQTVFCALLNGAALYPHAIKTAGVATLPAWLQQEGITVLTCGAPLFHHFLDTLSGADAFPALRLVRLGSDAVSRRDIERAQRLLPPGFLLLNTLSTTETGPICMYVMDHTTPLTGNIVPVGLAVGEAEIVLLDEADSTGEHSNVGEIVVSTPALSPGYWRRPELTQAAFQPDPRSGRLYYHTGDIGRRRADGYLEHLGRKGGRVKIRGYSVEVAEVEAALQVLPEVSAAAVVPQPDATTEHGRLVAYVVPAVQPIPTVSAWRRLLASKLPDYMIPATFVHLATLPLNASGKVDRRALPAPPTTRPPLDNAFVLPRTPLEQTLGTIWSDMLGLDQVGIHDNFLEVGGNSLLATRVVAHVLQTLHVTIPLGTLLEAPTVAQMAAVVAQHLAAQETPEAFERLLEAVEGSLEQ